MPAQPQAVSVAAIARVRRAVGAEEEPGRAGGRRLAQRQPVRFALGDRQAIGMWANAADQHGVAVDVQVLRGDRGGDVVARALDELDAFGGGQVLEHYP